MTRLIASAGGDGASRSREAELLRYQLSELDAAALVSSEEDDDLAAEEERLARAASHRSAARQAYENLSGEDQLRDRLGEVVAALAGHPPLTEIYDRLHALSAELADIASDAHDAAERLEEDPERLAAVVARRAQLHELRRKYARPGGGLDEVMVFHREARERLEELESLDALASRLGRTTGCLPRRAPVGGRGAGPGPARAGAVFWPGGGGAATPPGHAARPFRGESRRGRARRRLAGAVGRGRDLPLGGQSRASLSAIGQSGVGRRAGPGHAGPPSGAARRPRYRGDTAPTTLVFDEVDAGIGGEASLAVGRSLADLGRRYQVLVVTHLAQVAAFADAQIAVSKDERDGRNFTVARAVAGRDRVVELSRMLSGQPDSRTARLHAAELLQTARGAG